MVNFKVTCSSFPKPFNGCEAWVRCMNNIKGGFLMTRNQIEYVKTRNQAFKDRMDIENANRVWAETNRHNMEMESEQMRSNVARESTNALQTAINQGNLSELERSHRAQEDLSRRSIEANTALGYANLAEQSVHNRSQEAIGRANAEVGYINAQTNMQNADTSEYRAINEVNQFLTSKKYTDQQRRESEARTEYYKAQTGTSIPARAVGDIINALDTVGRLALLFQ